LLIDEWNYDHVTAQAVVICTKARANHVCPRDVCVSIYAHRTERRRKACGLLKWRRAFTCASVERRHRRWCSHRGHASRRHRSPSLVTSPSTLPRLRLCGKESVCGSCRWRWCPGVSKLHTPDCHQQSDLMPPLLLHTSRVPPVTFCVQVLSAWPLNPRAC
jgi:hypothetical protein